MFGEALRNGDPVVPESGISEHEALNRIIEILDGPNGDKFVSLEQPDDR